MTAWNPKTNGRRTALIRFGMFASSLYSHEVTLHVNHNIEEFKAPFSAKSLKTYNFFGTHGPTKSHISMLHNIVVAAHGLLDTFLGLSVSDMLALPPHIYGGRVIYAVIILIKIHTAITMPGTGCQSFICSEDLRLEVYLETLECISRALLAKDERSALSRAFLIISQLKDWFYRRFRRPSEAEENKPSDLPIDNGQGNPSTHGPTARIYDLSVDMQSAAEATLPENVAPPDGHGCQFDEVIQPPVLSNSSSRNSPTVVTDTWFQEFFNVEMLN